MELIHDRLFHGDHCPNCNILRARFRPVRSCLYCRNHELDDIGQVHLSMMAGWNCWLYPVRVIMDGIIASGLWHVFFARGFCFFLCIAARVVSHVACSSEPGTNPRRCTGASALRLEPMMCSPIGRGCFGLWSVFNRWLRLLKTTFEPFQTCQLVIGHHALHSFVQMLPRKPMNDGEVRV